MSQIAINGASVANESNAAKAKNSGCMPLQRKVA